MVTGKMTTKTFKHLKQEKDFGIVFTGAGGPIDVFAKEVAKVLVKEGLVESTPENTFKEYYTLSGNVMGDKGRIDLVVIFSDEAKPNIGKLAMWRLRINGVKWIDDFIVNYKDDYVVGD